MTPEQALELVDKIVSRVPLSRQEHDVVKQAILILTRIVEEKQVHNITQEEAN